MSTPAHKHAPSSNALLFVATALTVTTSLAAAMIIVSAHKQYQIIVPWAVGAVAIVLAFLLALFYRGMHRTAAAALLVLYSATAAFSVLRWGAHTPFGLIVCALIVSTVGIILGIQASLQHERALLEQRIAEHKQAAQAAHMAQMAHISRFAEFGKLAGGIFHDIANPLTAFTLTLDQIEDEEQYKSAPQTQLQRLRRTAKRMETFMTAARRQLQQQTMWERFCLNDEVENAIDFTAYKAKRAMVAVNFFAKKTVYLYGNPIKCYQALSNLISNAIDAYEKEDGTVPPYISNEVRITLHTSGTYVKLVVQDWGIGIPSEHLDRIFDPFFTTKKIYCGTGIGLAVCKQAIEQDCGGRIVVASTFGKGTTFTIIFPLPFAQNLPPALPESTAQTAPNNQNGASIQKAPLEQ